MPARRRKERKPSARRSGWCVRCLSPELGDQVGGPTAHPAGRTATPAQSGILGRRRDIGLGLGCDDCPSVRQTIRQGSPVASTRRLAVPTIRDGRQRDAAPPDQSTSGAPGGTTWSSTHAVPRVHDRVQAGLLAEMSGEKTPASSYRPPSRWRSSLSTIRESGSSRAGLDPELAGESDRSARSRRTCRAGRCDHAPSGEVSRQRARCGENDQYPRWVMPGGTRRLRQVPDAACEGCSSGCPSRRDGPDGTRCPERERRASTRHPDGCRAW